MISGTEPQWKLCTRACCFGAEHRGAASHGVPQVITSITGNPNGSGQSMGNTALRRFQRHAAGFNLQCPAQARSPTRISLPRFIMASLSTCLSQIATRRVRRVSRTHLSGEAARPGLSNHPTLADEDLRAAELSLPERPPPGFRKCVQVVREPAEWPTKLI